ncbi:MAG: PAS domain S-box protein [Deltaproteobacteria bacterium]|nr:PAS domain S-box protein [Deltaproteobacteria bacterium]
MGSKRHEALPRVTPERPGAPVDDEVARLRAALATAERERDRYRTAVELSSDYAYSVRVDEHGAEQLEWGVGAFQLLTGFSAAELAARGGWLSLVHPADRAAVAAHRQRVLAGRGDVIELRIIRRDGEERWVRSHDRPHVDRRSGRVVRVDGATRDVTDRRRLEIALRASEIQFRTLADTTSAAILLYDEQDRVFYVNPATSLITGFSREELLAKSLWDLVHPEFHDRIRARRAARTQGEAVAPRATMRVVTRDGSERWVDYSAGFAEIGGRQIAIGTAWDVTAHARSEAAIRRERDFSEAILSSLPGVFYLYNDDLEFLRWNRNFEQVLGYSADEIRALSPLDLFTGPDRLRLAERIAEVFARGASDVEAEFTTRDGRRVPFYFTGQTLRLDGRLCLIGTGIDITPRKRAEAALLETRRRLEEAQQRARLGSWEIDPATRRSDWSAQMYALYERDPALGEPSFEEFFDLTHPDDRQRVRDAYRGCLASGATTTIEFRARTAHGEDRWLSGTIDCVRDASGAVVRLAGTVLDITERKRAADEQERLQAALRRSEVMAAMGALVGGVAHEVRNPLFGISATLDAMQARFGERAELDPYLGVLRGEIDRLGELMRDLLAYGKPYATTLTAAPLAPVIAAAVESCRALAREAGVELACDVPDDLPAVRMDVARLRQVFENLLRNALQLAPRQTTVEVSVRRADRPRGGGLVCVVADRGPGFAAEDLERVFDPFVSRRPGGTGLGLSIVQRIVEEHGGTVAAANRAGGGAALTVCLPLEGACQP